MPRHPQYQRDPGERYEVDLCGHCHHPGGQHVWGHGCLLCPDCPGWDEATRRRGWWSDAQTAELRAAMRSVPLPASNAGVIIPVTVSASDAELLSVLVDPEMALDDLGDVIGRLVSHARDGVLRPGAWERDWLVSVFSLDFTERLERDPQVPHHDRARKEPGAGEAAGG